MNNMQMTSPNKQQEKNQQKKVSYLFNNKTPSIRCDINCITEYMTQIL